MHRMTESSSASSSRHRFATFLFFRLQLSARSASLQPMSVAGANVANASQASTKPKISSLSYLASQELLEAVIAATAA